MELSVDKRCVPARIDAYQYVLLDKANVSLDSKRVSRQEVSSVALNSHKISYD
jgi:pyruvate kinase